MKKKITKKKRFSANPALIIIVGGFVVFGGFFLVRSFAATSGSPYGAIDNCALVGNNTVIYGWAADPQDTTGSVQPYVNITVNSTTIQAPTNVAHYRDAQINAYINKNHPSDPNPGTYGFTVTFSKLYKGTTYKISGTALNYGIGTNAALGVSSSPVDGGESGQYFAGGVIPSACLATAAVIAPTPTPTPTPTPVKSAPKPVATPPKKSTSKPTTKPKPVATTPTKPTVPAPSSANDATSQVGTISAIVTVPADGASKVHLNYGPDGDTMMTGTDVTVSGDSNQIALDNLAPDTIYDYTITRTNSVGVTATSPSNSFTTQGFTIVLHFTNGNGSNISGIKGSIDDDSNDKATSDKSGNLTFSDLSAGGYTITYTYNGKSFKKDVITDDATATDNGTGPQIAELKDTINVDDLVKTSAAQSKPKSSGSATVVVIVIILFVLLGFGGLFFFLRRKQTAENPSAIPITANMAPPVPLPYGQPSPPAPQHPVTGAVPTQNGPVPEHMGQSLRDMVLEAMQKEAQDRKYPPDNQPK